MFDRREFVTRTAVSLGAAITPVDALGPRLKRKLLLAAWLENELPRRGAAAAHPPSPGTSRSGRASGRATRSTPTL